MNVDLRIQLGIRGPLFPLRPIQLDSESVGSGASWAGSYHILHMARHYDDYAITGRTLNLPTIPGFPLAQPYTRLAGKIRATGVTGNFGEVIAALFAVRYLYANA